MGLNLKYCQKGGFCILLWQQILLHLRVGRLSLLSQCDTWNVTPATLLLLLLLPQNKDRVCHCSIRRWTRHWFLKHKKTVGMLAGNTVGVCRTMCNTENTHPCKKLKNCSRWRSWTVPLVAQLYFPRGYCLLVFYLLTLKALILGNQSLILAGLWSSSLLWFPWALLASSSHDNDG